MGSVRLYDPQSVASGIVLITGWFSTDSSGDIENGVAAKTDLDGDTLLLPPGFSAAAKTGTGTYSLTLTDQWEKFLDISIDVVIAAASKIEAQLQTFNPKGLTVGGVTAKTITFATVDKSAGSAVAFNSKSFFVHILAKNTPVWTY